MRIDPTADRGHWESAARDFAPLRPVLHRYLAARVRDHHVAEDLVQETLLRGIVHARELRERKAALSWLLRIAWHVALDWHRHQLRRLDRNPRSDMRSGEADDVSLVAESSTIEPCDEPRSADRARHVIRAGLRRLPPLDRMLLIGYHFSGLSCRELAARSRLTRDSVKQRLSRARRRLRRTIDLTLLERPRRALRLAG